MEMEVVLQHLTSFTVAYDKANELEGEAHREAFISLFRDTLNMMHPFVADAHHASWSALQRKLFRHGKSLLPVSLDLKSFWNELDRVAADFYEDDAAEHELIFEAENVWRVLVAAE